MRGQRVWKISTMACTALAVAMSGLSVRASEKEQAKQAKPTTASHQSPSRGSQQERAKIKDAVSSLVDANGQLLVTPRTTDEFIGAFDVLASQGFPKEESALLLDSMYETLKAGGESADAIRPYAGKLASVIESPQLPAVPGGSVAGGANEDCAQATAITCGTTILDIDMSAAGGFTNNYDITAAGCTGFASVGPDLVYTLTLGANQLVTIDMADVNVFDASLYVVTDCGDLVGSCVAGSDECIPACAGGEEQVTFLGIASTTYYIMADSWTTTPGAGSNFDLVVTCAAPPVCGNSIVETGETCDDGNVNNGDGCDSNCQIEPACGNGIIEAGEQCDDGNLSNGDGCDSACQTEIPGNEDCATATNIAAVPYSASFNNNLSLAGSPSSLTCNTSGTTTQNDIWYSYTSASGCQATVDVNPTTYDGVVIVYSGSCATPIEVDCGDEPEPISITWNAAGGTTYYIQVGDWGSSEGGGLTDFDFNCVPFGICGDGTLGAGEECDDGNVANHDGCSGACELEGGCCKIDGTCINNRTDAECATAGGNYVGDGVSCTGICPVCGNGTLEAPEECDDGNLVNGDGCDSSCQLEAPANDLCTGALAVSVPGSGPVQSNVAANDDIQVTCGTTAVNQGLWYTVVGNGNTITVTTDNASTDYDTKIQVWCDCPAVLCVGGDDDGGTTGNTSLFSFCSVPGHVYYVMVGGFSTATGNHQLDTSEDGIACTPTVTCTPPVCGNSIIEAGEECDDGNIANGDGCDSLCQLEPATNDACIDRINITDGATAFDNSSATTDGAIEATCAFAAGDDQIHNDLWYNYTATCTGVLVVDTCGGGSFDTRLALYSGWACPPAGSPLVCDDDDDTNTNLCGGGLESVAVLNVTTGQQIKIRVGEFSATTGSGPDVLNVSCINPVCGNGTVELGEACDDGNVVSGDGCSSTCQIEGACCNGSTCTQTSGTACTTGGGIYQGNGVACGTQCVFGACCIGTSGVCQDVSADCCADQGGTFQGGTDCASVDCPCNITCNPGKTVEGEADCGLPTDTVNGGCNSTPFVTQPISCGQGYCGTAAFDGSSRDTDWFSITLASDTLVTWTISAEFDPVAIIVDSANGTDCTNAVVVASAAGEQCGAATTVSACLTAGTYELFVGPDFTSVEACGAEYTATVTCGVCPAPPPAPADNCPATALGNLNSAGSVTGTLAGSTDNFAAPTGCGIPAACGAYGNGNDVIYEFTAGVSGNWTWSLCGSSPDWDSSIQIRSTGACPGTACVAADDDSCLACSSPYEATITAALTSGTQYFVVVDSFSAGGSSNFNLSWSVAPIPTGACCGLPPAPNCNCLVQTEADCATAGGYYKGDGTTCGAGRCDCNSNGVCDQFDFQPSGGTPKGYSIDVIPDLAIPDAGVSPCGTCAVGQVCIDVNGDGNVGPAPDRCGVQTSFNVPDSGSITDVDVALDIIHTWEGDLIAIVEHGGVAVTLNAGSAGNGDLDGVYIFDDSATATIHVNAEVDITPGSYKPDEVLALFNGLNKQGVWTLSLADDVGSDLGTLRAWSLAFINDGTPPVATDCNGDTIPDSCQLANNDCNGNSIPDDCELTGNDVVPPGGDGVPDDCNCLVDGDCGPGETCDPCTNLCVAGGCPCVTASDCRNSLCADDNACNCVTCTAGVCVFTCTTFGNTNCSGAVTLDDILCVLAGFASFSACPNGDISPCGGNGIINLDDILQVLNAFGGANPCGCQPAGTPALCGSSQP